LIHGRSIFNLYKFFVQYFKKYDIRVHQIKAFILKFEFKYNQWLKELVIHHEESVEEMAKMIFLEKESLYMRG
jgi:hypothetical protein